MGLIFLNRFYWPETPATAQLLTDLAEGLADAGLGVTVITSRGGSTPPRETHAGVGIIRVRGTRWFRLGLAGKAADFVTFYLGALWRLAAIARRGDIIVTLTDPPLIGIGATAIAGLRGARSVHWVQDIYPELAISLARQSWLRVLQPLRDRAWRRAAACVSLGTDMAAVLQRAGVDARRQFIIPNWPPVGLAPVEASATERVRAAWGVTDKFVIGYSGNLGRVHDVESIVALAEAMRREPDVAFVIVGHGARRAWLEAEVRDRGLANVLFQLPQPRDDLPAALAAADVHLVTLRDGCEQLVFPSKLYGIAAAGRPVAFIGPVGCEVARLVRENDLGATAGAGHLDELVSTLRAWQRDPARRQFHANAALRFATRHSAGAALARWQALLAGLRACDGPSGAAKDWSAA
jgi:colanic acid biosynthesis glycosyl transferase WcaI